MSHPDPRTAAEFIDSANALPKLENTHTTSLPHLSHRLHRYHESAFRVSQSIHNMGLPVMQLPCEITRLIFEEVALETPPSANKLGWIGLSHVAAAWRQILLSIPSLWAREIGVFFSSESFQEMLNRAGGASLTVKGRWDRLSDHYWPVISQLSRIRGIELDLGVLAHIERLVNILSIETSATLHSIALRSFEVEVPYLTIAPHPNLRWVSFKDIYVPFHGQSLAGLLIQGTDGTAVSLTCDEFLDTLETCCRLSSLALINWMPVATERSLIRRVTLPSLRTMSLDGQARSASFIELCQHLVLPSLTYLALNEADSTTSDPVSTTVRWVLSNAPQSPCIKDTHRLSVTTFARYTSGPFYPDEYACIRIDDGKLDGMTPRTCEAFPIETDLMDYSLTGVHICFRNIQRSQLFQRAAAAWMSSYHASRPIPALKTLHLDSGMTEIEWDFVLDDLVDIETLYIAELSYIPWDDPDCKRDDGILAALSRVGVSGRILIPNLRTIIICEDPMFGVPDSSKSKRNEHTIPLVREMLSFRAARGAPVSCMRLGSAEWTALDDDNGDEDETDMYLQGLVADYLPHAKHTGPDT